MNQKRNLKEQITSLRKSGLKYSEICQQLNCSLDTVSYHANPQTRIKKNILKKKIRYKNKEILIAQHGGACKICSYNKSPFALQFHHLVPEDKEFGIAANSNGSIDKMTKESQKCILLCANCHAEVENKAATIPDLYLNEYLKLKNNGYFL